MDQTITVYFKDSSKFIAGKVQGRLNEVYKLLQVTYEDGSFVVFNLLEVKYYEFT